MQIAFYLLIEYFIATKLLLLACRQMVEMPIGFGIRHVLTAWGICTMQPEIESFAEGLQPYSVYNRSDVIYKQVELLGHGHAPQPLWARFLCINISIKLGSNHAGTISLLTGYDRSDERSIKLTGHGNV